MHYIHAYSPFEKLGVPLFFRLFLYLVLSQSLLLESIISLHWPTPLAYLCLNFKLVPSLLFQIPSNCVMNNHTIQLPIHYSILFPYISIPLQHGLWSLWDAWTNVEVGIIKCTISMVSPRTYVMLLFDYYGETRCIDYGLWTMDIIIISIIYQ